MTSYVSFCVERQDLAELPRYTWVMHAIRGSQNITSNSIAWSFIPRGNDTHFTVVLLIRFGALAEIGAYQIPMLKPSRRSSKATTSPTYPTSVISSIGLKPSRPRSSPNS
ncbi:hypothetical protein PIB30_061414 [Stylosanthes scabra]|uniref:Uncharacterized protein n=1 Tax=Stylosanthes scabra TaxID=79078 RepID=A0ABU6WKG0_9FABA|nr:hypothetical protein [Stylosanthes scabra]